MGRQKDSNCVQDYSNWLTIIHLIKQQENNWEFKAFIDSIADDREALIITRPGDRDVVMLSKKEYDNIMEIIHMLGKKENREWLLLGKKQAESGELREVEIQ